MRPYDRAYKLEMMLRSQYLATGFEQDFWNWVDAGLIRVAIDKSIEKRVRRKYVGEI